MLEMLGLLEKLESLVQPREPEASEDAAEQKGSTTPSENAAEQKGGLRPL